jgi:hypothetical protein
MRLFGGGWESVWRVRVRVGSRCTLTEGGRCVRGGGELLSAICQLHAAFVVHAVGLEAVVGWRVTGVLFYRETFQNWEQLSYGCG